MHEMLQGLTSADIRANGDFFRVEADTEPIQEFADKIGERVYGQPEAMYALARAVLRGQAGLGDKDRPIGTFMFLGPTGVGKTEAAKALAAEMTDPKKLAEDPNAWKEHFIRIDCSDFKDSTSINRIKGSDPKFVGYGDPLLIMPEALQKGQVVLFDEIEKAHPALWQFLMPVLEEGEITVPLPVEGVKNKAGASGASEVRPTPLDFRRSIVICTSNAGAQELQTLRSGKRMGFNTGQTAQVDYQQAGMSALEKAFKGFPEFLGRFDAKIAFNELNHDSYTHIFNKFIDDVNAFQTEVDPFGANFVAVTDELREHVLTKNTNREYGARNLRLAMQDTIISGISELKVTGTLIPGHAVVADVDNGEIIYFTSGVSLLDPAPEDIAEKGDIIDLEGFRRDQERFGADERQALAPPYDDPGEEHRDPGDETDEEKKGNNSGDEDSGSEPSNSPPDDDDPPKRTVKIGMEINIWNEDSVGEDGDTLISEVTIRHLELA